MTTGRKVTLILAGGFTVLVLLLIAYLPENIHVSLSAPIKIIIYAVVIVAFLLVAYAKQKPTLVMMMFMLLAALFAFSTYIFFDAFSYYTMDKVQVINAEHIQSKGAQKEALVVYNQGTSSYIKNSIQDFSEELAERGYGVTITTANPNFEPEGFDEMLAAANPGMKRDYSYYDLIILASPVYNQEVRPPLKEFMQNADFKGVDVYTLLFHQSNSEGEECMKQFAPAVKLAGGNVLGYSDVVGKVSPEEIKEYANNAAELHEE